MTTARLIIGAAAWFLITFAAAGVGARFMPGEWYRGIVKPSWTPPNAIFAPVWTLLYLMMAVSAWSVWRRQGLGGAALPLGLYLVQLLLNAAWSWLFFGQHRPGVAFIDIVALWAAILVTMVSFWRIDRLAGVLLIPYLAWVSFAAALNFALWRLNR